MNMEVIIPIAELGSRCTSWTAQSMLALNRGLALRVNQQIEPIGVMLTKPTPDESTKEGLMNRTISIACLAVALVGMFALGVMSPSAPVATTTFANSTGTVFMPAVAEWEFLSASAAPPTEAQCY